MVQMSRFLRREFCPSATHAAHDLSGFTAALKHDGLGHHATRNGEELLLGSAAIRVFSDAGLICAGQI